MEDLNTVQNNEQASKKKSNVLWIVFVALIIIAMAVDGFILFNKGRSGGKEPVDNTGTMTNDEMLESYRGLYPELSDDEIIDDTVATEDATTETDTEPDFKAESTDETAK